MPTMRTVVARCTAATAVALLSLSTCTTALADPGTGKGGGQPEDVGKPAAKEKGPNQNANASAKDPGPSSNANANATKKQAATATASAAAPPGNGNGNGAAQKTSTAPAAATDTGSAGGSAPAASDPVTGAQLAAIAAAPLDPPGASGNAGSNGNQGVANGRSADPSDATLGQSLGPGNRGTGKIHRDETSPLDRRNQPKVGCFDVTGFHFDPNQQLSISIVGHGGPNAGKGSIGPLAKGSDGSGNLLLNSQSLPAGMYKLTISTNRPGGVKHKVFKVTGDCVQPITPPGVTPPGVVTPPPARVVRVEGPVRERPVRPERPQRPEKVNPPKPPVRIEVPPAVPGVTPPRVPTLAVTGSNTVELAVLGTALALLGGFALLATRRRSPVT